MKARKKSRESLLSQKSGKKALERMPLVVNFHPALSGIARVIESLLPILYTSEDVKKVFPDKIMMAYRRPRNLKDKIVWAKVRKEKAVRSKEIVHTSSTFPLIVILLEWFAFDLVRYVIRFMSDVLLRLSENVSIIIRVVLPGAVEDRGVWRVSNCTHIFLNRITIELMICVPKLLTKLILMNKLEEKDFGRINSTLLFLRD